VAESGDQLHGTFINTFIEFSCNLITALDFSIVIENYGYFVYL